MQKAQANFLISYVNSITKRQYSSSNSLKQTNPKNVISTNFMAVRVVYKQLYPTIYHNRNTDRSKFTMKSVISIW